MSEFFPVDQSQWLLPLASILVLLVAWLFYRRRMRATGLQHVLNEISYDRIDGLLIPDGSDGEIQIEHLLLTSHGLLIVDIKDVVGTVFGSDKMQDWTVISDNRRYTFPNPQPALIDRIAAVRHIVRQVPVAGRIVFLEGAEFKKGVPEFVADTDELRAEFFEQDRAAGKVKFEAFKPHWDLVRKHALGVDARN